MPRTDEVLNTGLSSSAATRAKAMRELEKQKQLRTRAELLPDGEHLIALIEAERTKIPEILWDLYGPETKPEDVKTVSMALKMYANYLDSFKVDVSNILRAPKTKETTDE